MWRLPLGGRPQLHHRCTRQWSAWMGTGKEVAKKTAWNKHSRKNPWNTGEAKNNSRALLSEAGLLTPTVPCLRFNSDLPVLILHFFKLLLELQMRNILKVTYTIKITHTTLKKKQPQKEWVWLTSPIVITQKWDRNKKKKTEMKSEEQIPHNQSAAFLGLNQTLNSAKDLRFDRLLHLDYCKSPPSLWLAVIWKN